jgi:sugar/nucleoside kinase (ribokinase family)
MVEVPAHAVDDVDTTGCGDAFSAGFRRGKGLGRNVAASVRLGCAAAALVAQGLGSDDGDFHNPAADDFAENTPTLR